MSTLEIQRYDFSSYSRSRMRKPVKAQLHGPGPQIREMLLSLRVGSVRTKEQKQPETCAHHQPPLMAQKKLRAPCQAHRHRSPISLLQDTAGAELLGHPAGASAKAEKAQRQSRANGNRRRLLHEGSERSSQKQHKNAKRRGLERHRRWKQADHYEDTRSEVETGEILE